MLLKNNPRAAAVLAAMTAIPLAIGLVLAAIYRLHDSVIIAVLAGLLVVGGGAALGQRLLWLRTPRLAIERDQLLVYLRGLRPIRVPLEVVECLFLGQAPSLIWGSTGKPIQSTAIVVRLAERAKEWHQRDGYNYLAFTSIANGMFFPIHIGAKIYYEKITLTLQNQMISVNFMLENLNVMLIKLLGLKL